MIDGICVTRVVCVIRLASAGSLHAEVVCVIRLVAAGTLRAKMNACKRAWGVGMQSRVCSLSHACATGCACSCVCVCAVLVWVGACVEV